MSEDTGPEEPTTADETEPVATTVAPDDAETAAITEPADVPAAESTAEAADVPAAGAGAAASRERAVVSMPRWVAVVAAAVVGVLLVGGIGFAIGRATGDDGGDATTVADVRSGGQLGDLLAPMGPGRGIFSGNRVLLGVLTQPGGDGSGATIVRVVSGSPADDAGLRAGDVVTALDGDAIERPAQLVAGILRHQPGDQVRITYRRDGESKTVTVRLAAPADVDSQEQAPSTSATA